MRLASSLIQTYCLNKIERNSDDSLSNSETIKTKGSTEIKENRLFKVF